MTLMLAFALSAIGGCTSRDAPALSVQDLVIVAPLPGKNTSVAYAILHNRGKQDVEIALISSPDFGAVELHETSLSDGVARMHRIEALNVPAGSSVRLAPGGKHLMLMGPTRELEAGTPITLRLHFDAAGQDGSDPLVLQAPLSDRADLLP